MMCVWHKIVQVVTVALVAAVESVGKPVGDSCRDGVALGADGQAVLIVAQNRFELGLGFGLGLAAAAFDDALARRARNRSM
jgi:hypothetical protein